MSSTALTQAAETGLAGFLGAIDHFSAAADEMGVSNGLYISFSGNTGLWTIKGQEVEAGTQLAFAIHDAKRGWVAWKNNKPVETVLVSFVSGQRPPTESELTDHWDGKPKGKRDKETDGWREVIQIPVRDLEGGPQMDLTLPAEAPWRPVWRLIKQYGETVRMKIDDEGRPMIPLVEIGADSFDSKGGKKYSPTMKIVEWQTQAGLAELIGLVDEGDYASAEAPNPESVNETAVSTTATISRGVRR